ncbi:MAG TPA: hypothetical protein PLK67_05265, partial [Bryobacteraceae bacterium]|nr:hypothetical protein [Bryobacteraceae bacterium]
GEDGRLARGKSGSARADDPDIPSGLNRLDTAIAAEVLRALREAGGKVAGPGGAAERLGVPPTTLHSLMKRLGLKRPREFRRAVPQA